MFEFSKYARNADFQTANSEGRASERRGFGFREDWTRNVAVDGVGEGVGVEVGAALVAFLAGHLTSSFVLPGSATPLREP